MNKYRDSALNSPLPLPVLIHCSPEEREGLATFATFGSDRPVRALRDSDFTQHALRCLQEDERENWYALLDLIQALEADKKAGLRKAVERLSKAKEMRRVRERRPRRKLDLELGRLLTGVVGLPPDQAEAALDVYEGYRPPPQAESDLRRRLSLEISQALRGRVQLVLWSTDGRFLPALFCEDMKAALYVQLLLRFFGKGASLRICLHCGNPFVQKRVDQVHCSVTHRDAHRMARWRARGRPDGKQARPRGKKSGKRRRRKPAA